MVDIGKFLRALFSDFVNCLAKPKMEWTIERMDYLRNGAFAQMECLSNPFSRRRF